MIPEAGSEIELLVPSLWLGMHVRGSASSGYWSYFVNVKECLNWICLQQDFENFKGAWHICTLAAGATRIHSQPETGSEIVLESGSEMILEAWSEIRLLVPSLWLGMLLRGSASSGYWSYFVNVKKCLKWFC